MNSLLQQLRQLWSQLGINQRVTLSVTGVAVLAGMIGLVAWSQRPQMQLLYGRLSPKDVTSVMASIQELGVKSEMGGSGTAIYVPSDQVHKVRMSLASKGIPSGEGVGFEIFDRGNFGVSDFIQRTNYNRAIQGELGRTISQLQGVRAARVLVVCAEISSAHLHYGARLDRLIANTLFADGVAAAVVAADGPGDALRLARSDSVLMEGSVAEMAWEVGDHGFEMTLGAAVPDLLRGAVGPWVRGILAEEAIDPAAVGGWAIHPGGPRVIDAVLESLALEPRHGESSRAVLRDFGNMSSATLLFIMRAMLERGIPRPWVALAFGPGIAGESLRLA